MLCSLRWPAFALAVVAIPPSVSAQTLSLSTSHVQMENGQSRTIMAFSEAGNVIEAVCFDKDISVTPQQASTDFAGMVCFEIRCRGNDTFADHGVFRVQGTDVNRALDVNCIESPPVFINEFSYDDEGPDDREFVELYNRMSTPVDIGQWKITSQDPLGANTEYVIPKGTTIGANDYFVIGAPTVPNVDLVIGASDLWENDNESLTLRSFPPEVLPVLNNHDPICPIEDTVVYESSKGIWNPVLAEGEGIWGEVISIDGQAMSWQRIWDGRDTNNNGTDFALLPETPGVTNGLTGPLPYIDDYDSKVVGTALPEWHGSFADPVVIDPTVASADNPTAIAASPQGGNAAVFWNPSGGGNYCANLAEVIGGGIFEAYVYFESAGLPAGESEHWTVGFGTGATSVKTVGPIASEHTGVSWSYHRTATSTTLFLVDHNDGGVEGARTPATILGSIPITAANDGWQRLRLELARDSTIASFGGTLGLANGTAFQDFHENHISARPLYIAYTESITSPTAKRPFTVDSSQIAQPKSVVDHYGTATPTNFGTPAIDVSGPPSAGSATFSIEFSGLIPLNPGFFLIGAARASLPLPGGPPGATLLVASPISFNFLSSPTGDFSFPVAIPLGFQGLSVFWQCGDVDPTLGVPFPVGLSDGLEVQFG